MTYSPTLPVLDGADDPASVLEHARERKRAGEQADRDVMTDAAIFLGMHATDALVGPADEWHEKTLPLGGEGCPAVTEFAVVEWAAAMGMTPDAAHAYLSKVAEGRYRLGRCWERLQAKKVRAWRIAMVAEQTMCLSPEAAAYVDRHVAAVADKIGPAQLKRIIEEAKALFDPEQTEADRAAAAERRHVEIDLAAAGVQGTVHLDADLDLADALDLETAVAHLAHQLLLAGCTESLDVRRSMALGLLARGQTSLDLQDGEPKPAPRARDVVIHAHISATAVTGFAGTTGTSAALARVQEVLNAITIEQVRTWCGNPDAKVIIKPVLDLDEHIWVMSYEASDRLKDQTNQRDGTCVHPWCTRPAIKCDSEHRVPHDPDHPERGPTCTCNQAPLCRRHHRAKTTGGWTYVTIEPGVYLWRSPLGYQYLRDHTGTIDVTPDTDRTRYAHELIAHFGDQPPDK